MKGLLLLILLVFAALSTSATMADEPSRILLKASNKLDPDLLEIISDETVKLGELKFKVLILPSAESPIQYINESLTARNARVAINTDKVLSIIDSGTDFKILSYVATIYNPKIIYYEHNALIKFAIYHRILTHI